MDRIERVEVEGFKGIDSVEFDPGRFTVVTGRNNSGKTSLLESIDLAIQPSNIERFSGNLDTLIHHDHEECRIELTTTSRNWEVRLSQPPEELVPKLLFEAIRNEITTAEWWIDLPNEEKHELDLDDLLETELSNMIQNGPVSDDLSGMMSEFMIVSVNDDEYKYSGFGPITWNLYNICKETIHKKMLEIYSADGSSQIYIDDFFGFTRGHFFNDDPPELDSANFIDFMKLSKTLDLSEEETDPVKMDNIGDFLHDRNIVEELKTLSPEHLVFEPEDGEKYSVPFEHMGEGFKTMVGVLWHLLDDDGIEDVVLLEEPETHMHPGYVRELVYFLIELACSEDTQLFVTTHNNDFLNDFFIENLRDEERAFLKEEFRLLLLQDGGVDPMGYEEAGDQLKELKLDLRGL